MPSSAPRHFTFPHPIFGSRGAPSDRWKNSVYYLWWEFLRRHEGYKKTCEKGGKGDYADLYADFGNVHEVEFPEWWTRNGRGARLFAEPPSPNRLVLVKPDDLAEYSEAWKAGSLLVFVVPLSATKKFIEQRFRKLLKTHHGRRRGERTFGESCARYPIRYLFNINSLKRYLAVYDFKMGHPDYGYWQIGQELGLSAVNLLTEEELALIGSKERTREIAFRKRTAENKKRLLYRAAYKDFKLAQKIIDGVGRGVFPAVSGDEKRR